MYTEVILVNEKDEILGTMEKLEAHEKGVLHRAFSIFVFNSNNELLIHQRAFGKYHSEGLWTNTCCSHPAPGETVLEAAHRRLQEEMGFDCEMYNAFHFLYHAKLDNDLIEHELDHVVIGYSNQNPTLNPEEARDFKWIEIRSEEHTSELQSHHDLVCRLLLEKKKKEKKKREQKRRVRTTENKKKK